MRARSSRALLLAVALLATLAVSADAAGHALERPALWGAGRALAYAGAVGSLAACGWLLAGHRWLRSAGAVLAAALLALAGWVRGAGGVPPDAPILGVEAIAAMAALLLSLRLRERRP